MFWLIWILVAFVLLTLDVAWWVWFIWLLSPTYKVVPKPYRLETDKQASYIRHLCSEAGITRRWAIREALGEYKDELSLEEASEVIEWLLED